MARKQLPPRIEERGGTWYIIHAENGRSQRTSLRTEDLYVAQNRFQGWLTQRNSFEVNKLATTYEYAHELYCHQHGDRKAVAPETLRHIAKPLNAYFGSRLIKEITAVDVQKYIVERAAGLRITNPDGTKSRKKKVSDGTVRKELSIMRAVFAFMVKRVEPRELRISADSLCYIELPPRPAPRSRILSDSELVEIRRIIGLEGKVADSTRINLYIWLLMETGARAGALRELTWDQVDLKAGLVRLNPYGRTQTNKRRPIIPISADLQVVLERERAAKTGNHVLGHSGQIRKSFERFCERHHLHGVTAHTFRHTFATRLAQNGASMVEIAQLLGDSIVTVEKNYLHYAPEYLRGAIDRLSLASKSGLSVEESADMAS
jgi:integrase